MSLSDNNIRKLSAAHARGLIDTTSYRRLRTTQLSALEFGKPLPTLPIEMTDISIPKQKIDAPHQPKVKKSKSPFLLIVIVTVVIVAGAAYYLTSF